MKEEIAELKIELSEEQKAIDELIYNQAFNTDFLLEEKDMEEYGEEVYKELYTKKTKELLEEYFTESRMQELQDGSKHQAAVAIIQCLVEIEPMMKIVITKEISSDSSEVTKALKKAAEAIYRKKLGPVIERRKINISYLHEVLLPNRAEEKD